MFEGGREAREGGNTSMIPRSGEIGNVPARRGGEGGVRKHCGERPRLTVFFRQRLLPSGLSASSY